MSDKLTPGKNILWESSRMMLPEHKNRLIQHRRELASTPKPLLDEQRLEEMAQMIGIAANEGLPLRLTLYDNGERLSVECLVHHVDLPMGRMKIRCSEGCTWVRFSDLISVDMA